MPHRTIAIGDIHGCSPALAAVIDAIDPRPDDLIITLGDYIDRGPDSRGVLDLLIALGPRCRLVPLLGNHDQMLLDARRDDPEFDGWADHRFQQWLEFGGVATLDSYGDFDGLGVIPPEHLAFLEGCRNFFETETHIFTHAGYVPDLPLDEQPIPALRWQSLRDAIPGPHRSGKVAIVGHTSQKRGEILDLGHLICIDTYCYGGGWLTALEVGTRCVWQADERGRLRG